MTELCPTHLAAVDTVAKGICAPRPRSYLLLAPPGCEPPTQLYREVEQRLCGERSRPRAVVRVAADTVKDGEALVDRLIRGWTEKRPELAGPWEVEADPEEEPQYRLEAFGDLARREGVLLVALMPRFGKLFWSPDQRLESVVLAALRNLEMDDMLATVNGAALPYRILYERRAQVEPSFTSDYGQNHLPLPFGRMEREEAKALWLQSGYPLETRLEQHYFELALTESGGFRAAFEHALGLLGPPYPNDSRARRATLRAQLPELFVRVLEPEGAGDLERAVCDACARIHQGRPRARDGDLVKSSAWGHVLVMPVEGEARLACEALGAQAVTLMYRRNGTDPPEKLYLEREYALCLRHLLEASAPEGDPLRLAAEMMGKVFPTASDDLLFRADTPWPQVATLASSAVSVLQAPAQEEFRRWEQIARAHARLGGNGHEAGRLGPSTSSELVEDAVLYLGTRLLAAERERPELATHLAIPLAEDTLRLYVVLVLGEAPLGRAFQGLSPASIPAWWGTHRAPFVLPKPEEPLMFASLALLAAIRSAQRGRPLFEKPEVLARVLGEEVRNVTAHRVFTPGEREAKKLLETARWLLARLAEDGKCSFSLADVERFLRPPQAFLEERSRALALHS